MSLRLNFNASAIRAQLNLQTADRLLGRSTERLSSGLRLNRSADDPSGLTIANALRYQVRGLATATDNVENGINLISTAEGALDEVSTLLNRMRGLALSAANEGANDGAQLLALQRDLNESIESISRIADTSQFGSMPLLNGNMAGNTFDRQTLDSFNRRAPDYFSQLTQDYRLLQDGIVPGSTMEIAPASGDLQRSFLQANFGPLPLTGSETIASLSQNGVALTNAAGQSVSITGPLGSLEINIGSGTTLNQVLDRINGTTGRTGLRAEFDASSGQVTIASTVFGNAPIQFTAGNMSGTGVGLFDANTSNPNNNPLLTHAVNQTIELTYNDRNGVQTVILEQDPSINGGRGFSNGAFTLVMRDTSASGILSTIEVPAIAYTATRENPDRIMSGALRGQTTGIEIPDIHALTLAQGNGTVFRNLDELRTGSALTSGRSEDAIAVIDAAIAQIGQVRGRLGALQASSLESTAASLRISSENLRSSESRIRDTDFALESAEFTRQQTMLQAATAMLAQANQIPNRVVQLLGQ